MKILIMIGSLYPSISNNANLAGKLISTLSENGNEIQLLSLAPAAYVGELPEKCFGVPVHWVTDQKNDLRRRFLYPAISKIVDPHGFSDALYVMMILRQLKEISKQHPFDALVATMEPFTMAYAASKYKCKRNVLYIMDPPACISNGAEPPYRNRVLPSLLRNYHAIITTPFIHEGLIRHGFKLPAKTQTVGFPMVSEYTWHEPEKKDGRIHLLFCGWLYSDIRSPEYFLDIVSRLDDRFSVTFMGKECDKLQERYHVNSKAEIITIPNQPYETALQAMQDADILINIGNSVPVHIPSKTLEYINTGKSFVNFYKMKDCPTLYYTSRYPLCLNIYEGDDIEQSTQQFVEFCLKTKGRTVNHAWIEKEYKDCTPRYIAEKILENLGD